jgi:hypothetical protein
MANPISQQHAAMNTWLFSERMQLRNRAADDALKACGYGDRYRRRSSARWEMNVRKNDRLSDSELVALFERLFPQGFTGPDVLADIAPEGWERSPLLACFHPSIARIFEEQLQIHQNIEGLGEMLRRHGKASPTADKPQPEPTLESGRREHQPSPVRQDEEVTELVGQCLWDVFSDNHDVIMADGRTADIGSFRGASAFLDDYLTRAESGHSGRGDYMRFYLGSICTSGRADLMPVYSMIFRRLYDIGADWIYHFPEIHLVDLTAFKAKDESTIGYSPARGAAAELKASKDRQEVERLRNKLADGNARAREEAMDRPPPATVRAYRSVYAQDPRGWPPT